MYALPTQTKSVRPQKEAIGTGHRSPSTQQKVEDRADKWKKATLNKLKRRRGLSEDERRQLIDASNLMLNERNVLASFVTVAGKQHSWPLEQESEPFWRSTFGPESSPQAPHGPVHYNAGPSLHYSRNLAR
jgi:hypothetical protein